MAEQNKQSKNPNVILESDLPVDLKTVETEPIVPGQQTPPSAGDTLPFYFRGSIAATLQHDVSLVKTGTNPRQAVIPLMPPAPSGNPQNNAAIESIVKINQTSSSVLTNGMIFKGVWSAAVSYAIGNVVLFNNSAYVAIKGSLNLQPDLNSSNWTLLSENFVFDTVVPNNQQTGIGPLIGSILTFTGTTGPLNVGGTPATQYPMMIAIVQIQLDNGSSTLSSIPAGWSLMIDPGTGNTFPAGGSSNSFYYKVFTSGSVSFTSTLSTNCPWQATVAFFQFGGLSEFHITNVSVSGTTATFTCNNTLKAGNLVNFSGLTGATFANGLVSQVLSSGLSPTQFEAAVPAGHTGYNASDNGIATQTVLQYTGWSSGAGGSFNVGLTGVQLNSILVAQEVAGGVSYTGATLSSRVTPPPPEPTDTNTPPNTYTVGNASGGASMASTSGIAAVTYSSPNNAAGNITINVTATGSFLDASGIGGFELPGGVNAPFIYKPYDVIEFRGSIFVCLSETTSDPFTSPSNWGIVGPATGYAQVKTANYIAVQSDEGNLLSFNSSTAVSLTLPNPLPTVNGLTDSGWWVSVVNIGSGVLTVSPNGLTLDGGNSSLMLFQNQGCLIFTDGSNFFTLRGVTSGGGVNSQTVSYLAVASDNGKLITMNGSSLTLTLPATPPSSMWWIAIENVNATSLTVSRNGLDIDGSASNLTLSQNQGVLIFTDGINYFTERGMGSSGGSGAAGGVNAQTSSYLAVSGDNGKLISMNGSSLTLTLPASPPSTTWWISVEDVNSTNLTISPNGLDIDGSASNLTLTQNQGVLIFTDGSNYFTSRGMSTGGSGAPSTDTYVLGTQDFTNLPNSVANPTAYYGVNAQPTSAGSLDDEFDAGSLNLSRWTWFNQGSATATLSHSCCTLSLASPSATDNNIGIYQTSPSTPWQAISKMVGVEPSWPNNRSGMFVTDGTKLIAFDIFWSATNTPQILIQRWSNATTFSATSTQFNITSSPFYFMSIKDDGTNLNYYLSFDGINYWLLFQEARTAFLTPSNVGLVFNPNYATSAGSSSTPRLANSWICWDYFRRTL